MKQRSNDLLELPRLNAAELLARFGRDEQALRRYRMLAALREGRAVSEVAKTFGISRESLRRLRLAFQQQGLNALHSRKRGGGHLSRNSLLAQTMLQELRINPGISAASLWQRVQDRLRQQGQSAPRSSFYRILASLRDDDAQPISSSIPLRTVREALSTLAEEPPLNLGRSQLAELLLADESNTLQRGRRLYDTLCTAITRLRPSEAGPVLDDPRWRHYLILAGEYQTGEERAQLASALALSTSTYGRAKREALERLAALIPEVLNELPPTAPPAALIEPPPAPHNFDQEAALDLYTTRLRRHGLALIWGPAGVGKTDLAAMLAERLRSRGQQVIWHRCRPPSAERDAGLQLQLSLATALALAEQHELWHALNAPQSDAFAHRFEILNAGLTHRHWTIILTNTHWLSGPEASRIMSILLQAQQQRHIRLVLVGRYLPSWVSAQDWPPLPYASDTVARQAFIVQLSGESSSTPIINTNTITERTNDLLLAISQFREEMPADQHEFLLSALRPIEQIINSLRQNNSN